MRRLEGVSRYENKYTVKMVEHPVSVIVRGSFSCSVGRGGL